jgi:hypothetical protein
MSLITFADLIADLPEWCDRLRSDDNVHDDVVRALAAATEDALTGHRVAARTLFTALSLKSRIVLLDQVTAANQWMSIAFEVNRDSVEEVALGRWRRADQLYAIEFENLIANLEGVLLDLAPANDAPGRPAAHQVYLTLALAPAALLRENADAVARLVDLLPPIHRVRLIRRGGEQGSLFLNALRMANAFRAARDTTESGQVA